MTRYIALCKIVELGSFTRAADALGYTQAAVSQMIRSLEDEYKITFFIRSRSGIRLTPEGEALYPIICSIVSGISLLSAKASEFSSLDSGEIKIGASSALSLNILPDLLRKFNLKYPGIRFELKTGEKDELCAMLLKGEIMTVIGYDLQGSHIGCEILAEDRICAVFPPSHKFASQTGISSVELSAEPLILYEYNPDTVSQGEMNIKFSSCDISACLEMASNETGIALLPEAVMKNSARQLKYVPIEPTVRISVVLAHKSDYPSPAAHEKFVSFLRESIGEYFE